MTFYAARQNVGTTGAGVQTGNHLGFDRAAFRLLSSLAMQTAEIIRYITDTFAGVETAENFGYTFFFYGADHKLPFATLATADNEYDRASNLSRPGVFRLNIGVSPATYRGLFGAHPGPPATAG